MTLKSEVEDRNQNVKGTYIISSNLSNGKPYWLQEFGNQAIWFCKIFNNWKIGDVSNIGNSSGAKFLTHRGTAVNAPPNKAYPWKQFKNGNWKESKNIIVREGIIFGFFYDHD